MYCSYMLLIGIVSLPLIYGSELYYNGFEIYILNLWGFQFQRLYSTYLYMLYNPKKITIFAPVFIRIKILYIFYKGESEQIVLSITKVKGLRVLYSIRTNETGGIWQPLRVERLSSLKEYK